jgi:conjugative relaxase-like TrwC/TraI family protein
MCIRRMLRSAHGWCFGIGFPVVLSSSKIGTSSWRYYQNQVAGGGCDYYLGHREAPGRWTGRGLPALGLAPGEQVEERELEALFGRALHPVSGEPLGRAWRVDGVTGYDLTFSAPKSVSTVWALGTDNVRDRVEAAHAAAVQAALAYLDTHAAFSRVGTDGTQQVPSAGLAVAVFDHRTSRAGDPQLHSHALVLNKVRCADGAWRTLDGHELFHHKKSAGVLYQAALRAELRGRLDFEFTEVTKNGQAEIAGVPKLLLKTWSKRTAEISKEANPKITEFQESLGRPLTQAERIGVTKTAVLKTRPAKEQVPESVLHARWRTEAAAVGVDRDAVSRQIRAAARRIRRAQAGPESVGWVVANAVTAAGRARAAFSRADLVIEIANRLTAVPATADQVRQTVERLTDTGLTRGGAVYLGAPRQGRTARASNPRYATPELLGAEARVLDRAERGQRAGCGVVDPVTAGWHADRAGLDPDQRAAVFAATTSGDAITVITAAAGTGKTTALGVAARIWADAGYTVLALAPTARAAAELGKATGTPADTVAKWLHDQHRAATQGPGESATSRPLDTGTVLIVDEASTCNTHHLDAITAAARAARAKVVLVGDPAQIGVVEGPGGLLGALADRVGAAQLTGVHRFTQPWERAASLALRRGLAPVLATYQAQGRIHPAASHDAALDAVFAHWAKARAQGRDALMMARTCADVERLNERARQAGLADGTITGPEIQIGTTTWQAGDVLRTRRNDRNLPLGTSHLRNGDRFRVLGPGPAGGLLVEDLAGRGRAALPAEYVARHAQRGWAATIDAAQGCTADIGILLVRAGMDREHLYVGLSRGRLENHAHVAPEPVDDDHHHHLGPPPDALTPEAARTILAGCLRRVGGQQAAHTVLEQTRHTRAARSTPGGANQARTGPEPLRAADRSRAAIRAHQDALRTYQDRCRDREDLARTVAWLQSSVRVTERHIRDLPRFRKRDLRAHLVAQLGTGQRELDTALGRLRTLDHELPTLKDTVDELSGRVERERSRLEKSYMRPPEPPIERPPRPARRPAPVQTEPSRSLIRTLAMHETHQRGYGIEL